MPLDIESSIDEAITREERAVRALEKMAHSFEDIADSMALWCKLESQRFDKEYPVRTPREAVVTHVKSEEERLRESQGATGESLDEWTELNELGPREREVVEKAQRPKVRAKKK